MKRWIAIVAVAASTLRGQTVELKTVSSSPMQYYLSLPHGWTAEKQWPLIVVIESANRDFEATANLFAQSRGQMPFILAVPLVITNGGTSYRQVPTYRYSDADWARIEQTGGCAFDQQGISAMAADLHKNYHAEEKFFLAGWEAGGHTVWTAIFGHPEALRAAALAGPNYQGRCVSFSTNPAAATLPVKVFLSGIATDTAPNKYVHQQSERAKSEGEQHGFHAISLLEVPGKHHGPMPEEILKWFNSLRR